MEIQIKEKTRNVLIGLMGICMVSFFTYLVVKIYVERSDEKHQISLAEINKKAEERDRKATIAREGAKLQDEMNYEKLNKIEGEITISQKNWNDFQREYLKNSKELNKLKDEKIHVNDNASITEQSTYISKYKYKPY